MLRLLFTFLYLFCGINTASIAVFPGYQEVNWSEEEGKQTSCTSIKVAVLDGNGDIGRIAPHPPGSISILRTHIIPRHGLKDGEWPAWDGAINYLNTYSEAHHLDRQEVLTFLADTLAPDAKDWNTLFQEKSIYQPWVKDHKKFLKRMKRDLSVSRHGINISLSLCGYFLTLNENQPYFRGGIIPGAQIHLFPKEIWNPVSQSVEDIFPRQLKNIGATNIPIINVSLENFSREDMSAMQETINKGKLFIIGAGNSAKELPTDPKHRTLLDLMCRDIRYAEGIIIVLAGTDKELCSYSNYPGDMPLDPQFSRYLHQRCITAPGISACPDELEFTKEGQFEDVIVCNNINSPIGARGTSLSAPWVTGAVALVLETNPHLTPQEAGNIVLKTARKQDFEGKPFQPEQFGVGYLNISAAVRYAKEIQEHLN